MFVNMQHDFPKRDRLPQGARAASLLAWIDGGPEGSKRIEYPMKRVACPGETR